MTGLLHVVCQPHPHPNLTPNVTFQAAAQADAVKNGGGVVFFPAGSYAFASNISLASNVLIRGAPVNGAQAKNGKNPGNLNPTTIFTCPNRMHQGIWNFGAADSNIGVVNVFLDQCAVSESLPYQLKTAEVRRGR